MKCWHIPLAISRVIEKVVVVVVVMMREGSLGSADRFDWENLSEARLAHASSLRRVSHICGEVRSWVDADVRVEAVGVGLEEAAVRVELEGDDQGGKEVMCILSDRQRDHRCVCWDGIPTSRLP